MVIGHVTSKGQVMTPIRLEPKQMDSGDAIYQIGLGLLLYCAAVQSAALATAWLLVILQF